MMTLLEGGKDATPTVRTTPVKMSPEQAKATWVATMALGVGDRMTEAARLALLNSAYDVAYFNGRIDTILERSVP